MNAYLSKLSASLPLAAAVPVAGAFVAALGVIVMPQSVLEGVVMQSGIPALIPAAAPPLGVSARAALALIAAALAAGVLVAAFGVLARFGSQAKKKTSAKAAVKRAGYRRADAHPDAPPREPLRVSRDLDAEFSNLFVSEEEPAVAMGCDDAGIDEAEFEDVPLPMSARDEDEGAAEPVTVARAAHDATFEADIPADLDQRLADYDPDALPETPRERAAAVAPLHRPQTFEAGERFETFELTPPVRTVSPAPTPIPASQSLRSDSEAEEPMTAPETDATVLALLERLERGIARRDSRKSRRSASMQGKRGGNSGQGLSSTLDDLRRMAVGG